MEIKRGIAPGIQALETRVEPSMEPLGRPRRLGEAARHDQAKVLRGLPGGPRSIGRDPVLVLLAAGKGTRFGASPKCVQNLRGTPLARRTVEAFAKALSPAAVAVVGYRHEDVAAALGDDLALILSDDPAGGTAFAAYEALSLPGLLDRDPLLVIAMGDRIVPSSVFSRLVDAHLAGKAAELSFLTAIYEPPRNRGKGRILRDGSGKVLRIIEERDFASYASLGAPKDPAEMTEGNCPLYAIRACDLERHLSGLTDGNAQGQFYLTDLVASVREGGGEIRTITVRPEESEYEILCADVTRVEDLAALEKALESYEADGEIIRSQAESIAANRPRGQTASMARQIEELQASNAELGLGFKAEAPVAIGFSGGRMRIAFMHPDMGRFFGPAWQMPIGAADESGTEQIVLLAQKAEDRLIHLRPLEPKYRESLDSLSSDDEAMYPGEDVSDWHSYEGFGTSMSERLLQSLGYFTDEELETRRRCGQSLPPPSLWIGNNMRRPFTLVGNAISSIRTLREGDLGERVQAALGRESFSGLRIACTGGIPKGGFSSSSALTLAAKNAIDRLYGLGIPQDTLIDLACQAEYGTGVRAGSLDQATEQKGLSGLGTLISSNPADGFRILGTYPVPSERFRVIFPYSVERDREAWRWSWSGYARAAVPDGPLTAGEMRKLTGKSAEMAAILTGLEPGRDFFPVIQDELLADGLLSLESREWIRRILLGLPLLAPAAELRERILERRERYAEGLAAAGDLDPKAALAKADSDIESLFAGWRDPLLRRASPGGVVQRERGVPLRAMVAYLFSEVARNFHLIRNPDTWIESVTLSQRGDRCVDLDPERLPDREAMEGELPWETSIFSGPALLDRWLERFQALPFDHQRGLDDESLSRGGPPDPRLLPGGNFFRGLALIDLAEAMLKRAFGGDAVAVRVNAAGQGDFFQVHVDTRKTGSEEVKRFLRAAFYRRFGLEPDPDFVELHPGGGAGGILVDRFANLSRLAEALRTLARST